MDRRLELLPPLALTSIAIWITLDPPNLAELLPQQAFDALFGWFVAFSVLSWPVLLSIAVKHFKAERDWGARATIAWNAAVFVFFGVVLSIVSIVGKMPSFSDWPGTLGLFVGGLSSALAYLWHEAYR